MKHYKTRLWDCLNVLSNFLSFIMDRLSDIQTLYPIMWKKQLRLPVTAVVRRFSSISRNVPKAKYPEPQMFSCLSSCYNIGEVENFKVSQNPRPQLLASLEFSGRNLCTDSFKKVRCWNCNAVPRNTGTFLVCESCRCIQPVDQTVDYFQIFGLWVLLSYVYTSLCLIVI